MPIYELAISEKGAVELLKDGATLHVESHQDAAFDGGGGIRGLWTMRITATDGHKFVIRKANVDEIKQYKSTLAIGSIFHAAGFDHATIPLKVGAVADVKLDVEG
jgi:hypothetical protein